MNKAHSLTALALLLAGCGAPAYMMEDVYFGHAPERVEHGGFDAADRGRGALGKPDAGASSAPAAPGTKQVVHVKASATMVQLLPQHTQTLHGTVTYTDGTQDGNIAWSSSDQTIVTVNPTTGEVSGVRPGNATIQARAGNDYMRFLNIPVTVRHAVVEDVVAVIEAPQAPLKIGDSFQLEAHLTNSSSQAHLNGHWSSSNQQVAYVNDTGLVTGRRPGTVTITYASDQKASVSARVALTVVDPAAQSAPTAPTAPEAE